MTLFDPQIRFQRIRIECCINFFLVIVYITGRRQEVLDQAVKQYHQHATGELIA